MRPDVARDLGDSAHDFLRVVWPVIKPWCRGGELKPVEAVAPQEFEKQLDTLAGIDAWQVVSGEGIRGISSRIQWPRRVDAYARMCGPRWPAQMSEDGDQWWESFTIRKSRSNGATTEWEKRIRALDDVASGFIRPSLIVHAYIQRPRRTGDLLYVCMCRADDLFRLASDDMRGDGKPDEGDRAWYLQTNPQDGNEFAVFPIVWLKRLGVYVRDWRITSDAEAA